MRLRGLIVIASIVVACARPAAAPPPAVPAAAAPAPAPKPSPAPSGGPVAVVRDAETARDRGITEKVDFSTEMIALVPMPGEPVSSATAQPIADPGSSLTVFEAADQIVITIRTRDPNEPPCCGTAWCHDATGSPSHSDLIRFQPVRLRRSDKPVVVNVSFIPSEPCVRM